MEEKSTLQKLRELEVGQSFTEPASKTSYVRRLCAGFGFEWNRKYETRTDKEKRTITATRVG